MAKNQSDALKGKESKVVKQSTTNKLDIPLENFSALDGEVLWQDYNFKNDFEYVCEVKANVSKEKLEYLDQVRENMERPCVYVMVINGKIFKIGSALRGMKLRIISYNSGKAKYKIRGTNGRTNYWVLQSMIKMKAIIKIYAYYPPTKQGKIFGVKFSEPFPSAKAVEGILLALFEKQHKMKPIGCAQG